MTMKATRRRCPLSAPLDDAGLAATASSQARGKARSGCNNRTHGRGQVVQRRTLMVHGRSLGLPPLAGVANYQEAARTGLTVEQNVRLLKRYAYVERRLMEMSIAHLCAVPEWEVKCALSLHCWLDAEHATVFRDRVAEMREPPLHLDAVPDDKLAACLDEALHAH